MAAFKIHEDIMEVENMDVAYNGQKHAIVKQSRIPTKKLPLRQQNSQVVKQNNFTKKQPLQQQVYIKQEPAQTRRVADKENAVRRNTRVDTENLSEKLIDFKLFDTEKEEDTPTTDTIDFFNITRDSIYFATSIYQENIYKYLLHLERTLKRPKYGYMDKQPELSYKMRSILIDWLSSVSEEYNLHPQTLQLAVHYLDTFLSRMSVVKHKFQLVGTAAMLIASKYEEIYPPDAKEFVYLTADTYTIKQLKKMEQLILKVLQFDLAQPTAFSFIVHLSAALNLSKKTTLLAMYLSELVLFEGDDYLQYLPSQLAFGAIALARHTLNEKDVWPIQLQSVTGYSVEQLYPLIIRQQKSFIDSPQREQKAIPEKYKTVRYGRVALIKPRTLNMSMSID